MEKLERQYHVFLHLENYTPEAIIMHLFNHRLNLREESDIHNNQLVPDIETTVNESLLDFQVPPVLEVPIE